MTTFFIRFFDILFALSGLIFAAPLLIVIFAIGIFDTGAPIFRQRRVGIHQKAFTLIKFRTMKLGTEEVATHQASKSSVTSFGHFLRRTKLDELPQLWNVLKGEMSFVGPRPCLFSQRELIDERMQRGVFNVKPGITGLAQINEIDMSTPKRLAEMDQLMSGQQNVGQYLSILLQTLLGKGAGDRVE